jgi:hypothetical protein
MPCAILQSILDTTAPKVPSTQSDPPKGGIWLIIVQEGPKSNSALLFEVGKKKGKLLSADGCMYAVCHRYAVEKKIQKEKNNGAML